MIGGVPAYFMTPHNQAVPPAMEIPQSLVLNSLAFTARDLSAKVETSAAVVAMNGAKACNQLR